MMSVVGRVILHVDMDAFFVSVELRRRPELAGRPVVVGGTGRRGVVAAASYEARRFGVYSAMPSMRARQLCPAAVFLPGDHHAYAEASAEVFDILGRYTPLVEPLSLDEAFLDVTGAGSLFGAGADIGWRIRTVVDDELGLSCSVGVAPNKFLAKMASVEAKPRARPEGVLPGHGVFEVRPGEEIAYLHPLPVGRLWGVGPATLERLARLGVDTIGDLTTIPTVALRAALGATNAERLVALAGGHDDRPVEPERAVKSVSHEETFATDLHDLDEIRTEIVRLCDGVAARLRASGLAARTVTVKVRDPSFRTVTRAKTVRRPLDTAAGLAAVATPLVEAALPPAGLRLLGVAASKFSEPAEQLQLSGLGAEGDGEPPWGAASQAIDRVRGRFGSDAIGPASTLSSTGLRPVRRGEQQWGPHAPGEGPNGNPD
jgi:DNA polymerase IV